MSETPRCVVLVVDDSRTMRGMIRTALTDGGYEVIEAGDGHQALVCLQESTPDAVISDVNMPRMNGIDFVRAVRREPRFASMPILVLTTESAAETKAAGKAAGATGWIVKPFRPEDLRQVVARVIERARSTPVPPR